MQHHNKALLACLAITGTGMLFRPVVAHATIVIQIRCTTDTVIFPQDARARLEWARACGTKRNVGSPTSPIPPAQSFLTGALSANGGIPLVDYRETDDPQGKNSYSGDLAEVNQIFFQTGTSADGNRRRLQRKNGDDDTIRAKC